MGVNIIIFLINIFLVSFFAVILTGFYQWYNNMKLIDYLKVNDNYKYEMYWGIAYSGYPPSQIDSFYKIWDYLKDEDDYTFEKEKELKKRYKDSLRLFLYSVLFTFSIGSLTVIIGYFD